MDSYVTRIYRRDGKDPRKIVGVVEQAGVNGRKGFRDSEELVDILTASKGSGIPKNKKKRKNNSRLNKRGSQR